MLLVRFTEIKRSLDFSPMWILSSGKGFTGCFIGGGKSIYLSMWWSYLWEFIHPSEFIHPYGARVVGFSLA
jgi:hypothetical protein